jgi:photosystem II stability/assembly factor-like uncharacterized protein
MRSSAGLLVGLAMQALAWLPAPLFARDAAPRYLPQVINPDLSHALPLPGAGALLIYGSDATILRSTDGLHWSHARTPGDADLAGVAANTDGSVLVAVGQASTLLRSIDGGQTWQAARLPKLATDLRAVVNVGGGEIWVAAGTRGRILRSTDHAKTWTLVESRLEAEFLALHHDLATGLLLLGGENGLVGFSQDQGLSWQVTAIAMPEPATPVTGFHRFGQLLLATSALGRFLTSSDDAQSWDLMQASSNAFFTGVAFDPERGSIVMSGHNGDVLRSTDGGRNWLGGEVTIDGRKSYLSTVMYHGGSKSLLTVGQGGAVARSIDGGASWSKASDELRGELRGLVEFRGRLLTFGSGGAIASSDSAGSRWSPLRNALEYNLREIAPAAQGPAMIATGRLGELIRSVDRGASWQSLEIAYPNMNTPPDLRALVLSPSQDALLALGPPGAILRSNPDGSAWQLRHWTELEAERAFPWALVDQRRKLLVAVEARGGMQVSVDDGVTWETRKAEIPSGGLPLWHGVVLERDGVMIVAGDDGIGLRSDDAARSWKGLDTGTRQDLYGSFADERSGLLFLAGAGGTLLRSADLGISWRAMATGTDKDLRRLLRDPRAGALLCFGASGTILRSPDGGITWKRSDSGTEGSLRKGMLEPGTQNLLIVGSRGALLRSMDGGRHWERLDTHTTRHFSSFAADKQSGDLVLVGERIVRLVRQSSH